MSRATIDHDAIREWVEKRKGRPSRVKTTGKRGDPGVLRIDFPGYSGEDTLEEIEWDEWFEAFDANKLAFLHEPAPRSRFNKLVDRGSVTLTGRGSRKATAKKATAKKAASSAKKASSSAKKATSSAKKALSSSKKPASSAKKASSSTKKTASSAKKASSSSTKSSKKAASSSGKASKSSKKASTSSKKRSSSKKASAASGSSVTTTNRDEIRKWVDSRGGFPATVAGTERRGQDAGVLRIDYPGYSGEGTLERIEWDDWFDKFDREKLAFVYQKKRGSRFSKLVAR